MYRVGGPQYSPPGQQVPGAALAYRPPRAVAASQWQPEQEEDPDTMGGAMSGAQTGFTMGSAGGPVGAAIGTAAGAIGGAVGANLQAGEAEDSWKYRLGQFLQGKGPVAGMAQSGASRLTTRKEGDAAAPTKG